MAAVETISLQENRENRSADGKALALSSPQEFEQLFKEYYHELCRYCIRYVRQEEVAEEIVQDVFVKMWQQNKQAQVQSSVRAYLYAAVKNSSLNYLKSQFARQKFEDVSSGHSLPANSPQNSLEFEELVELLREAVEKLPQQCRTIFEMSRSGGFTYQEISRKLDLSPKTVENQMGIALKKLKEHLRAYWDLLVILLVMLSNTNGNF